jgi:hypothetical protein
MKKRCMYGKLGLGGGDGGSPLVMTIVCLDGFTGGSLRRGGSVGASRSRAVPALKRAIKVKTLFPER